MERMGSTLTGASERKRVETVVETLANIHSQGESLAELAHDARNMVTALSLYCELLEEPGVLGAPYRHYGSELRLVAAASRRLVEKLVLLDTPFLPDPGYSKAARRGQGRLFAESTGAGSPIETWQLDRVPNDPIGNLREELLANHNLLAAVSGPSITVALDAQGGELPVSLTSEDLTRVVMNLVKNAAESMRAAGKILITLRELPAGADGAPWLVLGIEDSGPGIQEELLEKVFDPGYTTGTNALSDGKWPSRHQGLGLAITRSIIEAAGGRIHAENGAGHGARFEIELPVRTLPSLRQ
jgi:signal transduction histidine kinase